MGEISSTTLENCIGYTGADRHELSMCFNFHHLKVDYKNGQKWELMPPDRMALKKLFKTWQEGVQFTLLPAGLFCLKESFIRRLVCR